jgi:sulfite reductase alpha subunit-like flavoprotein
MGESGTQLIQKVCCGGGCILQPAASGLHEEATEVVVPPSNDAYRSLNLKIERVPITLTNVTPLPAATVSFEKVEGADVAAAHVSIDHPPQFVTPHPPYKVHPAQIVHARELTKPGAEKRTYHFDLDVTNYPAESGDVDFVVGGAIGVCAPNSDNVVEELFDLLLIPRYIRDRQVLLKTENGRWPTIWGDGKARELLTTRRELLMWCSDLQSYPPTKDLLRLLAEYATGDEKKILMYLTSAQGQGTFCE